MTTRFAAAACALVLCAAMVSCASEEGAIKPKKRPPLPGENVNELSWGRPTGPNDIHTPFGMPMSR